MSKDGTGRVKNHAQREQAYMVQKKVYVSIDDAMKLPSAPMRTYVQFEFVLYNRVNRLLVVKQIVSKGFHFRPFTSLQYIYIFEKCHF